MTVADTLRSVPLFAQLRDSDIERISQVAQFRTYPKNNVIVFEDDPSDALYVLTTGQVR